MIYEHLGARPRIHDSAVVAPTAVVSGDVEIGPDCQVLHGAVITAEGGPIVLGEHVIVMENALIRATAADAVHIGAHSLLGTLSSVAGADIGEESFLASGARVFNGARVGARCEIRVNAIV
ncbi:MAG: gamma carbonic anhydrase family protein, partial [Microbacterium sp.]